MIIKISQTSSNIKQSYDIQGANFSYVGNTGSVSRLQSITMSDGSNILKGVYSVSKWYNYIPLRYLFGAANLTQQFLLYKNDDVCGSIVFSRNGLYKNCYVIALDIGEIFHCYCRSVGSFDYVSIYREDTQIALVETCLSVKDYKYTHSLYITDDYGKYADFLSFFVLYYASYNFAERMHMSKGTVKQVSYSFSRYNHKYDPKWRETHFPDAEETNESKVK